MILDLVYYGDPILRKKCKKVEAVTDDIKQLAKDLAETMIAYRGAGLAAPQVGRELRMFVICYDNGKDADGYPICSPPKIYINPILSNASEEMIVEDEGCLSIPGLLGSVKRPKKITVEAMDIEGNIFTEEVTYWKARAIMHENDHLNGVLYTDRLSPKEKKKLAEPLKQLKKKYQKS